MSDKSILLLDTEKNILQTYQTVLEDVGYTVSIATSQEQALELFSKHSFAFLITELYLKGVTTIDIIREFKQASSKIYIIMVSAASLNPELYDRIINAGVDDFFTKPLSSNLLLTTIKKGQKKRLQISKNICLEEKIKKMEGLFASYYDYIKQGKIVKNIRSFNNILQNEIIRSKRYNHPFSLLILKTNDIDKNKISLINDINKQSDNSLLEIINTQTRKTDFILGNNGNFALILVETPIEGTKIFKDRLQQEISRVYNLNGSQNTLSTPSLKINYFAFPEQSDSIRTWIFSNNDDQDGQTTNQSKLSVSD